MDAKRLTERKGMKICFVHNMYINYRLPIFERLARKFDITFFFDEVDSRTAVSRGSFNFKVLRSVPILMTSPYHSTLSPTLVFHLLKEKCNIFLGSDMGYFGTQIAFLVSRFARKPFVLWNETWYWTRTSLRVLMWPFIRSMLMRAETIIVSGSKARDFVTSCHVDPDKVFVAPNAVQILLAKDAILKGESLKTKLKMRNKTIVLYFGRLVERKGVSCLIDAFARLRTDVDNAFLVIAGEGPFKKEAQKKCRALAVKDVLFTGFVSEKDKALYFSLADVFVLPSIRSGLEVEVWGLALNEAMSLAKPVISTTAVGGAYDLIRDGVNGYIVKEGDVNALYENLKKLLTNPDLARNMGLEAKKTIEKGFTFDHMTEGFVKAFHHAMTSKSMKSPNQT